MCPDGPDLIGMSCYLPDWEVPGHAAQEAHASKLDALFGLFGSDA